MIFRCRLNGKFRQFIVCYLFIVDFLSREQEKHKVSILNTREAVEKLRPQIIQSPERIKADMARMHNALSAGKSAKDDKGRRLQEIRAQQDRGSVLLEASQQGVQLLTNTMAELEKQKLV